jgi:hypothetical protein
VWPGAHTGARGPADSRPRRARTPPARGAGGDAHSQPPLVRERRARNPGRGAPAEARRTRTLPANTHPPLRPGAAPIPADPRASAATTQLRGLMRISTQVGEIGGDGAERGAARRGGTWNDSGAAPRTRPRPADPGGGDQRGDPAALVTLPWRATGSGRHRMELMNRCPGRGADDVTRPSPISTSRDHHVVTRSSDRHIIESPHHLVTWSSGGKPGGSRPSAQARTRTPRLPQAWED